MEISSWCNSKIPGEKLTQHWCILLSVEQGYNLYNVNKMWRLLMSEVVVFDRSGANGIDGIIIQGVLVICGATSYIQTKLITVYLCFFGACKSANKKHFKQKKLKVLMRAPVLYTLLHSCMIAVNFRCAYIWLFAVYSALFQNTLPSWCIGILTCVLKFLSYDIFIAFYKVSISNS